MSLMNLRRLLAAMVIAAVAVGACSSSTATTAPTVAPTAAPTAAPSAAPATPDVAFTLKYGSLMSFTGDMAATGATWNRVVDLAIKTIEDELKKQGLDGKIKLQKFSADDGSTSTTGIEAANKLVKSDRVSVILGPCCSGVTVAVAQSVTIPAKVPMFTIGSSPTIGALDDDDTVFRTTPTDEKQGGALAQLVTQQLGNGKTVNIGARNDAYGQGLISQFAPAFEALGGKIGLTVQWDPKQTNFDTEAQKLVSNNPDGWVFFDYQVSFANMAAALARTGKLDGAKSFAADSMVCDVVPCPNPVGMMGTQASVSSGDGHAFLQQVLKSNPDPNVAYYGSFEPQGWDAVFISFLAALRANSAAPADIAKNIRAVTDPGGTEYTAEHIGDAIKDILAGKSVKYVGATGPCVFDAKGDVATAIFVVWGQKAANEISVRGVLPNILYTPRT